MKSRKIKIGVLGAGGYGRTAREYLNDTGEYELVACADLVDAAAKKAAEQEGATPYTDINPFLGHEGMEAVCINTPVYLHASHAKVCLEAGKHVFITKPVTAFPNEARELKVLAQKERLCFMVGHHARFSSEIRLAENLLKDGTLGRLCNISVNCCSSGGLAAFEEDSWRMKPGVNPGGPLLQCGIHTLDSLIHLLGRPERVFACAQDQVTPADVIDNIIACIQFPHYVQVAFICNYTTAYYHAMDFFGTKGNLHMRKHVTGLGQSQAYLQRRSTGLYEPWEGIRLPPPPAGSAHEHGGILEKEFARQIREGEPDYSNLDDATAALSIVHAAVESSQKGKTIHLCDTGENNREKS